LGIALVKQDSLDKTTAQLDTIFRDEPRNQQALINMGNIHFISGRLKAAEECYLQAERFSSGEPGLYLNLAILFQSIKVESPSDSIPSQGESEKYLLNAFNLLSGDEDRALDLLQIAIKEMDEKEIEQLKSDAKKLVMATKLFLKSSAAQFQENDSVKGAGINTKFLKKGPDKNHRYILWWASSMKFLNGYYYY
jgi:tetratricopeptide (TPR) repeat protein